MAAPAAAPTAILPARWESPRSTASACAAPMPHTLNEHIEVDSLAERGRLMAGLLATLE